MGLKAVINRLVPWGRPRLPACSGKAPVLVDHKDGKSYLPFRPLGRKPAIFFVHIPKTAGSSVNAALFEEYGRANYVDHIEHHLPRLMRGEAPVVECDFVAGHVAYCNWWRLPGGTAYDPVTVLRDPWRRLVSHINWVDSYTQRPNKPHEYEQLDKVLPVAKILQDTDFSDRASLTDMRERINAIEDQNPFENYQARMLIPALKFVMTTKITARDVQTAIKALDKFAYFGFSEDMETTMAHLSKLIGADVTLSTPRLNAAQTKRLSPENEIAKEVLAAWFDHDQTVYDAARELHQKFE